MMPSEYKRLPSDVKEKVESVALERQTGPDCNQVSHRNRHLIEDASGAKDSLGKLRAYTRSLQKTDLADIDKRLKRGAPGVLFGLGISAPSSKWKVNHSVLVIGKTYDGDYVVHDPDITQDPVTERKFRNGTSETRDYLRIMSPEEILHARPLVNPGAPGEGPEIVPVFKQRMLKEESPSFSSRVSNVLKRYFPHE